MIFKQIKSGGDRNFAYLAASESIKEGVVVDPSPDPAPVINAVKQLDIKIRYIINTHSHFDHSGGNDYVRKALGNDLSGLINCGQGTEVKDGDCINIGELTFKFLSTPGHTPDSICIYTNGSLITGDTLFVGKVGGTYGTENAVAEFESLKRLMLLDPATLIWPGHDYGIKKSSTIDFEISHNPFIQRLSDFSQFLWLKRNWAEYKKEHGIK